jgi:hypothetical protein
MSLLNSLTVVQLKELAKQKELKGYSKLNKADLIKLLNEKKTVSPKNKSPKSPKSEVKDLTEKHLIPDLTNIVNEYMKPIKYVILITRNYPEFNEFVTIKPNTEEALLYVIDNLKSDYEDYKREEDEDETLENYINRNLQFGDKFHLEIIYGIDYNKPIYLNYNNNNQKLYRLDIKNWILSNDRNQLNKITDKDIKNYTFIGK